MVVARAFGLLGVLALFGLIGSDPTAAGAYQATRVCTLENGRKVRIDDAACRQVGGQPTASPAPTVVPLPCESIGGTKTFVVRQERMFCFDAGPGSAFVTVESTTPANVGCAYFRTELTSPSGLKSYGEGAYPMGTVLRTPGRHYFWVSPLDIADGGGCDTYKFTVR